MTGGVRSGRRTRDLGLPTMGGIWWSRELRALTSQSWEPGRASGLDQSPEQFSGCCGSCCSLILFHALGPFCVSTAQQVQQDQQVLTRVPWEPVMWKCAWAIVLCYQVLERGY